MMSWTIFRRKLLTTTTANTLYQPSSISSRTSALCSLNSSSFSLTLAEQQQHENRTLATSSKAKKKTKNKKNEKEEIDLYTQYQNEKAEAKAHRTKLYQKKILRQSNLPKRRSNETKNYDKSQFQKWFIPLTKYHSYLDRQARRENKEWKVKVSVMLERLPIVTPDIEDWEEDYDYLRQHLDRFGKQYPKELGLQDPMDVKIMTTKEALENLPKGYTPAPRETKADATGFYKTIDRKLKTRLYLTLRPDDSIGWILPTVDLKPSIDGGVTVGETFKDAARRAIREVLSEDVKILCLSNCPMAVDMVPYEEDNDSDFFGEKIFFMRVQYQEGAVDEMAVTSSNKHYLNGMEDWGWLDRTEMAKRVEEEKGEKAAKFYNYML